MQKFYLANGLIAYKTTVEEMRNIGSACVCDHCGDSPHDGGYLVPALNHWVCKDCFDEWKKRAKLFPQDVPIELRRAAYYESMIPCTAFAV